MLKISILLIFLIVILIFIVKIYNNLVQKRNDTDNAMGQIDVQLTRRYDLIPNMVEVAKRYMAHERDVLQAVTQARQKAVVAQASGEVTNSIHSLLASSLTSMYARFEAYPKLKADEQMQQLQEELKSTENRVAFARQYFNDAVMDYNNLLQTFPNNMIGSILGFKAKRPLDLPTVPVPQVVNSIGESV